MKLYKIAFLIVILLTVLSCSKNSMIYQSAGKANFQPFVQFPDVYFSSFSDPHLYSQKLGTEGMEFRKYLDNDRKLLEESEMILDAALKKIISSKVKFVVVSGDMTKDGEKTNHQLFAEKMAALLKAGIKVYVINGNHDINNGHAFSYSNEGKKRVNSVSDIEFKDIYREFGYAEAVSQDPDSLSYVVEPVKNLRLLMIDSCRWKENRDNQEPVTGGKISDLTLKWMESVLLDALKSESAVIAVMHHGILEHYRFNKKYYPNYVVENQKDLIGLFNYYNVRVALTGHFHAQDITRSNQKDEILFDIETGSLVTYPNPIRYYEVSEGYKLSVYSDYIKTIDTTRLNFDDYAKEYVFAGGMRIAKNDMKKYGVNGEDADKIARMFINAYTAHLKGDEVAPFSMIQSEELNLLNKIVLNFRKDLIEGWYTDLPPGDNAVKINLLNGSF